MYNSSTKQQYLANWQNSCVSCQAPNRSESGRHCGQTKGSSGLTLNSRVRKLILTADAGVKSAICYGGANSDSGTSRRDVVVEYRSNEASPRVSHQVQVVDNRTMRERIPPRRAAGRICAWVSRLGGICRGKNTKSVSGQWWTGESNQIKLNRLVTDQASSAASLLLWTAGIVGWQRLGPGSAQ